MSYILDALKKSEQERGAQRASDRSTAQETPIVVQYNWPAIGGLLLLLNVLLGGLLVWWNHSASVPEATASTAPAPATEIASEPKEVTPVSISNAEQPLNTLITPAAPAVRPAHIQAAPRRVSTASITDAPFLRTLSEQFQRSVPAMTVNIHVYSPQTDQSILYINNRQYRAGETLDNGARLEAIVPDGAVLSYNGEAFKLPRPN